MTSSELAKADPELRRARALARALDTALGIPGTPIRIGLDAILGLVPGGGDIAAAVLSGYIVLIAVRRDVPAPVLWRMLGNIGVDTVIGSIPILGDVFDVVYKSNVKNVALLERYITEPATVTKRSRRLGILVIAAAVVLLVAVAAGAILLARLVWRPLTHH